MGKKGGKVVPMQRTVNKTGKTRETKAQEELDKLRNEVGQTLQAARQEVSEAYGEIGALLLANRRLERAVNNLVQRLSQYEDVTDISTPEVDDEEGDE